MQPDKKALVLFSGGLDSATMLAIAQEEGYQVICLSFDYGQRHLIELEKAKAFSSSRGVLEHRTIQLDPKVFAGSALIGDQEVPKHRSSEQMQQGIPATYVPARNTLFLAYALGLAESLDLDAIFVGVNALDYSGYPDCRPEYIQAFIQMADLATRRGIEGRKIEFKTPLLHLDKKGIIERGLNLKVDYAMTHSCYDPIEGKYACGACDACLLRREAFQQLGIKDPIRYPEN